MTDQTLRCPAEQSPFPDTLKLARHLIDSHGIDRGRATATAWLIREARPLPPEIHARLGLSTLRQVEGAEPPPEEIASSTDDAAPPPAPEPPAAEPHETASTTKPAKEATRMPRPCGYCNEVGHGQKDCVQKKRDERKKEADKPRAAAAPTPPTTPAIAERSVPDVAIATSSVGTSITSFLGTYTAVKAAGVTYLQELRRMRDGLDEVIARIGQFTESL